MSHSLVELADLIAEHFDVRELKDLCFRLEVDRETLAHDTKGDLIREVLLFLQRRERLDDLPRLLRILRPGVNWDQPASEIPASTFILSPPLPLPSSPQSVQPLDVYISFADQEPDSTWVWSQLIPRLESRSLRLAVSGESDAPGAARVLGIEQGIQQARHTLVVLSPNYLAARWEEFASVLAQTRSVEERINQLIPLQIELLDLLQLPLRFRALNVLTFLKSQPDRAERNFKRLLTALSG